MTERGNIEKKTKFKDQNPPEREGYTNVDLNKFIKSKRKKGYNNAKIIRLAKKKFTPYISAFMIESEVTN